MRKTDPRLQVKKLLVNKIQLLMIQIKDGVREELYNKNQLYILKFII